MSDLNPHIVKEHEGDFENTIQYFVTGRPLTEEEMLPDSHGVHPVSPLGFMMKDDGTTLAPAEPLSGFMTYTVYDDNGNPIDAESAYADSFKVTGKYYMFDSDVISFPVVDIHRDESDMLFITVKGILPLVFDSNESIYFRNLTSDDYTPTGLVGDGARFVPDSIRHIDDELTELTVDTDIVFSGIVVEGKLAMCIDTDKKFLSIEDHESDTLSGIYVLGESEGEPIRKVFNRYNIQDESTDDTRPACYAGNGYSDTEVADWVHRKMGGITHHGCHPSSETGDLRDAGGLVNWFVRCGDVDITGGAGKSSVIVPGFGLGAGYGNMCPGTGKAAPVPDPEKDAEHKWLTFGYGTKHDAFQVDVGKTALPLDWPFTNESDYSDESRDNNITLVKEGVIYDDGTERKLLGALDRVSREECATCHGSGEVEDPDTHEMVTCPDCHGEGECDGPRYIMDRVHVCLYNDFKPNDDSHSHGHESDTTVLKKTFVNLATPITQKDGDTFEVTVSLPNIRLPEAYSGDTVKDLSGYYAYVSQPRVYVVSGTWEFSDTKVLFTTTADMLEYDLGDDMFKDKDGNDLADGTDVRIKVSFDAYPGKKFPGIGTVTDGKITLNDPLAIPDNLLRRIKRSADAEGKIHGSICGAAFVPQNNETLPSAIKTNIGLNAVRNENGALGQDMGNVDDGRTLQQYNKFYTADTEDTVRHHVLFSDDGTTPKKDQRQVVATVYPTVTNTFPWALTHRRKLGFLEKLMTMDADSGVTGIFARVYLLNQSIFRSIGSSEQLDVHEYPLYLDDDMIWYNTDPELRNGMSLIGAMLTIVEPSEDDILNGAESQPVRRAIQAAGLLAADYRNSRASRLGNVDSTRFLAEYLNRARIRKDDSSLYSYDDLDYGNCLDVSIDNNAYMAMANAIRLRHLPVILASAGTDPDTGEPISPVLNVYPYRNGETTNYSYYSGNPYGYGEYDTTARTEEVPCEVASTDGTESFAILNSVVVAAIKSRLPELDDLDRQNDLYRAAELCAIKFDDTPAYLNVNRPHVYRSHSSSDISWMEAIDAFTKLVSPDNIPVPQLSGDYIEDFAAASEQLPFIMTDAYGYYRVLNGWEADNLFIATTMPTDDALALFLKDYVPSYSARLASRNWNSYRVRVPENAETVGAGNTTYLTRMKWYDPDCDDDSRGQYAADAFLVCEAGSSFSDCNMNRIEFSNAEQAIAMNYSVPPYTVTRDYNKIAPFATENDQNSVSYIRVFMRFAFSEDAGRWYCVDYRQAPVSYLSPLYGAKALDQKIDGKQLWVRQACDPASWQEHLAHTYEEYVSMDINPALVDSVMRMDNNRRRLMVPYLPVSEGGLGLNAPVHKDGTVTTEEIKAMPHANFWNVRQHLRPATGATPVGDIRKYDKVGDEWEWGETGGIMSDAVLWGQYDYPRKGGPDYHLPDTVIPDADLTTRRLIYAKRNATTRVMDTGDIQIGPDTGKVFSVSYGTGNE